MEVQDLHVGNQLVVSAAADGGVAPYVPNVRDPVCLGIGPSAIPGSIFASGVVLIGNPMSYPAIAEAALMVARPALSYPRASALPSIFKITNK